jgi:hypothetical protein
VNRVLWKIFMAPLDDRIALKKAGRWDSWGRMLLGSRREIAFHKKLEQKEKPRKRSRPPERMESTAEQRLPFRRARPCDRSRQKARRSAGLTAF